MLLGKRPRPAMRRTTSLTEFSHDSPQGSASMEEGSMVSSPVGGCATVKRPVQNKQRQQQHQHQQYCGAQAGSMEAVLWQQSAPRNPRRHSGDFAMEAAHFLRECGLCKRRLGPGKDTFMYRGEIAFCSLECRQQQMTLDERKEKCSMASMAKSPFQAASAAKSPAPA